MKSIKNLLLAFIAVISLTSMTVAAPRIEKVGYHTMQLKQRINREFDKINVEQITDKDGMVRLSFVINENGGINILQSNYSDEKLYETVKLILETIQLSDSTDLAGREFNYQFKFKVSDKR